MTINNQVFNLPEEFKGIGNSILEVQIGQNHYGIGSPTLGDFKRIKSFTSNLSKSAVAQEITAEEAVEMQLDAMILLLTNTVKYYNSEVDIETIKEDIDNTQPELVVFYASICMDAHNFLAKHKDKLQLTESKKKIKQQVKSKR